MSVETLGLDYDRVNPNGGGEFRLSPAVQQLTRLPAIAFGHPLGSSSFPRISIA